MDFTNFLFGLRGEKSVIGLFDDAASLLFAYGIDAGSELGFDDFDGDFRLLFY